MGKRLKMLIIIIMLVLFGCSNPIDSSEPNTIDSDTPYYHFTGTIKEITGNTAIVYGKLGGSKGNVFVDLSVNRNEIFRVGDEVKVGYDGIILESNPAQINTLSVEIMYESIE